MSASPQAPGEVPEQHGVCLAGEVCLARPAQEGAAGQRQVAAAVGGEGGGAGGVALLQRVVAQRAVLVPAHRLLAARSQGGQRQTQPCKQRNLCIFYCLFWSSLPDTLPTDEGDVVL